MKAGTAQKIASLLHAVASTMRSLLKDTATAGNSEDLRTIAGWIAEVEELRKRVRPEPDLQPRTVRSPAIAMVTTPSAPQRSEPGRPRTLRREARFEREGEVLVKIAWSKKNRSEYEHKASRAALLAVVARVEQEGRGGKTIRMENVLPVVGEGGNEVPSYQAYLCVGWFKSVGLLEQHGRQGYTIPSPVTMSTDIDRAWADLPARGA